MQIQVLKSKLNVVVTGASKECEGSITLDPLLMEAAKLHPYERVEVNGRDNKSRIVTYVLEGECGSGQVELNGGAAQFFKPGDGVHVNCFAFVEYPIHLERNDPDESLEGYLKTFWYDYFPIIVKTDENNKVI